MREGETKSSPAGPGRQFIKVFFFFLFICKRNALNLRNFLDSKSFITGLKQVQNCSKELVKSFESFVKSSKQIQNRFKRLYSQQLFPARKHDEKKKRHTDLSTPYLRYRVGACRLV